METEIKKENIEIKELDEIKSFDLTNEEDKKILELELNKKKQYFKPENDITYKIVLNSPIITLVKREFEDKSIVKYGLDVTISDQDGEVFNGIWEVGTSILNPIFKTHFLNYSEGVSFKITKTGTGKNTRYNIVKDF